MSQKKTIPFGFIMDYLYPEKVKIKPMFGCFGLYMNNKIIFFLRDRDEKPELNGVWIATSPSQALSLFKIFPSLKPDLKLVQSKKTRGTWLLISAQDNNFESDVIKACELVLKGDRRIGKYTKGGLY